MSHTCRDQARPGPTGSVQCQKDRVAVIRRPNHGSEVAEAGTQRPPGPSHAAKPAEQVSTHLDRLVRRATEEQVTHGIDTETPDRALMAHKGPFALKDLLRVIGCKWEKSIRDWQGSGDKVGAAVGYTHIQGYPCSGVH